VRQNLAVGECSVMEIHSSVPYTWDFTGQSPATSILFKSVVGTVVASASYGNKYWCMFVGESDFCTASPTVRKFCKCSQDEQSQACGYRILGALSLLENIVDRGPRDFLMANMAPGILNDFLPNDAPRPRKRARLRLFTSSGVESMPRIGRAF
jgi:hypothetical protein